MKDRLAAAPPSTRGKRDIAKYRLLRRWEWLRAPLGWGAFALVPNLVW